MNTYLDPKQTTSLVHQFLHPLTVEASLDDRDHVLLLCIQGTTVDPIQRRHWATHEDLKKLCVALRSAIQ